MEIGDSIIDIISQVRGQKTINSVSLKTPVKDLKLSVNKDLKDAIELSIKDFRATLFIQNLEMNEVENDYSIDNVELELETEE